jgi:hypothetical protein
MGYADDITLWEEENDLFVLHIKSSKRDVEKEG